MLNNKKGAMPALEELVKLIPHMLLIFVMLIAISSFYKACVAENKDSIDFDFERVITEIKDLSNDESINVPIKGYGYTIKIFQKTKKGEEKNLRCTNGACLCLYKTPDWNGDTAFVKCEPFSKGGRVEGDECVDGDICFRISSFQGSHANQEDETLSIEKGSKEKGTIIIKTINLFKKDNIVTISTPIQTDIELYK